MLGIIQSSYFIHTAIWNGKKEDLRLMWGYCSPEAMMKELKTVNMFGWNPPLGIAAVFLGQIGLMMYFPFCAANWPHERKDQKQLLYWWSLQSSNKRPPKFPILRYQKVRFRFPFILAGNDGDTETLQNRSLRLFRYCLQKCRQML